MTNWKYEPSGCIVLMDFMRKATQSVPVMVEIGFHRKISGSFYAPDKAWVVLPNGDSPCVRIVRNEDFLSNVEIN